MAAVTFSSFAGSNDDPTRYRRISICNILVKHDNEKFADEIEKQFLKIPVSEQYNDHNLSVRVVNTDLKKMKDDDEITAFVKRNHLGSRLAGKWFNRNLLDGTCNMDLVKSRGLYDASSFDYEMAQRSARGKALLEDAGEDLIGNTYLLMHEITYVDKAKRSKTWGMIGAIALGALTAAGGGSSQQISNVMNSTNNLISSYKGFAVKVHTRLYRLKWDDETSNRFYNEFYAATPNPEIAKKFEENRDKFKLEYVGDVISKGGRTSFLGIREEEPELMIRKACQRALDENVSELQKKYDQFRIKSPVVSVSPTITVNIGLKEGVSPESKYEVLEAQEKDGKTVYKRIAVIKPVPNLIWDNRFMAQEELAYGANFGATTFTKVSGGEIIPGYLVRQIE
ncbi:MAG: hypothetical protein K2O00_05945 [Muribaculaceae bacterium]|nr:hypothetical protein [Muribaculaceae bacterium]